MILLSRYWLERNRILIYQYGGRRAAVYRHFLAGWHCQTNIVHNVDNLPNRVRKYGSRNGAMNAARRYIGLPVKGDR